jgi:preprotein translocase subunit SecD
VANTYLLYIFGGLAFLMAIAGLVRRPDRLILWLGAASSGAAAWFAYSDGFGALVAFGLFALFFLILALPVMDLGWRARCGVVTSVSLLALLVLWPSLSSMTGGLVPVPEWVKDRVGARLVAGLDLRGGLRLMYTVDVEEAIKDKRDRYYEDMRHELAKLYADHSGDDAPSEEVLQRLREKVDVSAPRRPAHLIRLHVKEGADPGKIDARFRDLFKPDVETRVVDDRTFEFTIRQQAESQIRERAVSQARDIILRRVDELGLREAAVSTRDEDIIVEVPGEDEASFETIREIISRTARLEFKLLDDDSDFFAQLSQTARRSRPWGGTPTASASPSRPPTPICPTRRASRARRPSSASVSGRRRSLRRRIGRSASRSSRSWSTRRRSRSVRWAGARTCCAAARTSPAT